MYAKYIIVECELVWNPTLVVPGVEENIVEEAGAFISFFI